MALQYLPPEYRPENYGKTGSQPNDYLEMSPNELREYNEWRKNKSAGFYSNNTFNGESLFNPFQDMLSVYSGESRARKDIDTRLISERKEPVTSTRSTNRTDSSAGQLLPPVTSAKMNQQFFVWKDGQAGRLSLDMPFGFKEL